MRSPPSPAYGYPHPSALSASSTSTPNDPRRPEPAPLGSESHESDCPPPPLTGGCPRICGLRFSSRVLGRHTFGPERLRCTGDTALECRAWKPRGRRVLLQGLK